MTLFSFHSHSGQFCLHATGILEDVVKSAIERGFTTYGLSEHMPRYRAEELYPEESHLTVDDLALTYDKFLIEARRLQVLYKDQIQLLIGMETEYFGPQSIEATIALRQSSRTSATSGSSSPLPDVQYLVGSIHHVHGVPIDFSPELYARALETVGKGSLEFLFEEFFDSQYEMLQGLEPEVVGHLDLVRIFSAAHSSLVKDINLTEALTDKIWQKLERNIDLIIGYGGLFELNSRAWKKGLMDAYPQRDVLKSILAKGGRVTLSDDSHGPKDVGMFYNPKLKQYLEQMYIEYVYYLVPKEPHGVAQEQSLFPTAAKEQTGSFQRVSVQRVAAKDLDFSQLE